MRITFRKHPRNIDFALTGMDPAAITGPTIVYEGPVRGIAPLFPRNVNTMVACALATIGLDRCQARLIADPALDVAVAEVEATGRSGARLTTAKQGPGRRRVGDGNDRLRAAFHPPGAPGPATAGVCMTIPTRRRTFLAGGLAAAALPRSASAQRADTLRIVPGSSLTVLDPIWTPAGVTTGHAYHVFDTLFAVDRGFERAAADGRVDRHVGGRPAVHDPAAARSALS